MGTEVIVLAETLSSLPDNAIMGLFDDYELGVAVFRHLMGSIILEIDEPLAVVLQFNGRNLRHGPVGADEFHKIPEKRDLIRDLSWQYLTGLSPRPLMV